MTRSWLALFGLVVLAAAADDIDWSTQNKISYCDLISRRRIYKQQRLEIYCQVKVLEIDEQV